VTFSRDKQPRFPVNRKSDDARAILVRRFFGKRRWINRLFIARSRRRFSSLSLLWGLKAEEDATRFSRKEGEDTTVVYSFLPDSRSTFVDLADAADLSRRCSLIQKLRGEIALILLAPLILPLLLVPSFSRASPAKLLSSESCDCDSATRYRCSRFAETAYLSLSLSLSVSFSRLDY